MYKVALISLGCSKNLVDSEIILAMLDKNHFSVVNKLTHADIIIVNTCGFIKESKEESINTIIDACKYNAKVIVVGCLVQRYMDELKESIPEVDLYVPINEYKNLNFHINTLLNKDYVTPFICSNRILSTPKYQAYLRISDGCNNNCTYCAIPSIRGKFKSRSVEEILLEAAKLKQQGIKELVLISQDTSKYGSDLKDNMSIVSLLKLLLKLDFYSIRLLYLYPDEITDEFIDLFIDNKTLLPYFDIPFQHASNNILKAMNRRGTYETYLALINRIRNKIPHSIIRTTYIVGFPNESKEDFEKLLEFNKIVKFNHMGAFKYSKEDGTKSFDFKNQIHYKTKQSRYNTLMAQQYNISLENNKKLINKKMEGIVTGYDNLKHMYLLRSYFNAPDDIDGKIYFSSDKKINDGDIVSVIITDCDAYDLYAKLL